MGSSLHKKPFLDYQSQIAFLKSKQLNIKDEDNVSSILKKVSYYHLINGYKDSFKDNLTHNFKADTSFDDIYNLYLFDADLREVFLKYILIFEKHIKSSISYHFTNLYGNGIEYYQNIQHYDYSHHLSDIQKLFRKMNEKIHGRFASAQVTHYISIYHDVPLWVLTTDLTLGETATMYRYLKGHCKTDVCNDFHRIGRAELAKILIILTKFRNCCAHGNRLFNFHTQDALLDCIAHQKLHIEKMGSQYQYGKSDLFAAVISLKYVLTQDDFRAFYYEIKKIITKYHPTEETMHAMGFPTNWRSVLRIKIH